MTAPEGNKVRAQISLSLHAPPHLPCELVEEEILCRLPVKHLRQLCCVCKSWNNLISHDSKFAKKHLRFSIFNDDRYRLVQSSPHCSGEYYVWKSPISSFMDSVDSLTQLNHPLIKRRRGHEGISTCDGILCFGINGSLALLFNPSIRKFKPLPPLDSSGLRYLVTTYTIAYDRFIRNYKIIALSLCPRNKKKIIEVNVHTLDTDYWRKVQDFPYHVLKQGIFVSDTVNWLIYEPRDIVSFDLNKESYQQLLQPPYEEFSFPTYNLLGVLRDCLCIFSNSCKFSDIWMMKEYGNANSWTKLLRVPYIGDFQCYAYTKPLYLYEDDRVLMRFLDINKYILAIYDSNNNTSKTHEIQRNRHAWHIPNVYVESLISPFLQH